MRRGFIPLEVSSLRSFGLAPLAQARLLTGFTLIEILLVLAISAILVVISAGVFLAADKKEDVDSQVRNLKSVLNLARNQSLASEGLNSFGVHINTSANEYVLFPGSSFDPANPENKTFTMPANIGVSIELNGGGSDIIFGRLSGGTSQYGHIILAGTQKSSIICVSESGSVYIENSDCSTVSLEYTGGATDADLASFPGNSGNGDPAQSFQTAADSIYVRAVDLYIRSTTSSVSDVYLEIRDTSTVGDVLGASRIMAGSFLPSDFDWVRFVFPSPVFLSGNSQYFLRLRSLPNSAIAFSGAVGTLHWGYEHSATSPPAYGGGDAWRYAGRLDNPADTGQQLGPSDQYDFSFRVIGGIDPPVLTDSRHLEFNLGWSIKTSTTLTLTFHDPGNPDVAENISMADFFNSENTAFDWEGSVDVYGDMQTIRAHTHYIDDNDTILSIHRSRKDNSKALDILIDSNDIASYLSDGTPTIGTGGGYMIYR